MEQPYGQKYADTPVEHDHRPAHVANAGSGKPVSPLVEVSGVREPAELGNETKPKRYAELAG